MSGKPNDKWLATMIKKLGSREAVTEKQREIGAKGGSVTGTRGGFASSHELAVRAGRKGGQASRRGKAGSFPQKDFESVIPS